MNTSENTTQIADPVSSLQAEIVSLKKQLDSAKEKITWWEEQYKLSRHRRFGKSSEKHINQLSLFDEIEMPTVNEESQEAEDETITYTRKKRQKGHVIDTSILQREICLHDLSEEEKDCACCGGKMEKIGEDKREKLVYVPAVIKVEEHIYPKYTCRPCGKINMQKKEEGPLPKSMATSSLISEVILSKYEYHIPLYRRSKMFARDGIDLPDNTLGNWVMQVCEGLAPLREALWEQVGHINYLQADETPVKVLDKDKKGYMWCFHSPSPNNQFVIFDYHLSRGSEVPSTRLIDFQGLLQTDGYSGYNSMRARRDVINLGCFSHCRRKFTDAYKVAGKTTKGLAAKALKIMRKLYRIEQEIKFLCANEKKSQRQQRAIPLLTSFHDWLIENQASVLPKSQLGNAFNYAIKQWSQLSAYIDYGEANIDNNWVENQIRPFALGRRNWLFVGNKRGGHAAALLYSLIQTCKINNVNTRAYFTYLLDQIHSLRREEIDPKALLPQFVDLTAVK